MTSRPFVKYTYAVAGRTYTASRVRYTAAPRESDTAAGVVARHPVGAPVRVYYDPGAPGEAVMYPGINGADLFVVLFLTPFNVVMIVSWIYGLGAVRPAVDAERRFGRRVRARRSGWVVRLPGMSPLLAGALAATGISFLSVFVLAFGTGMNPSLGVAAVPLVLTAVGAVVVSTVVTFRRRRLLVDPLRRTIVLPHDAKTGQFGPVEEIEIERRSRAGGNSRRVVWVPTLTVLDQPGQRRRVPLGEFTEQDEAEVMRGALGRELGLKSASVAAV
jgi:hypothetical protein